MTVYLRTRRAVTITITNGATASVADGSTLQLAVSTTGSPAPTVAYSSSDELVATVSASGLVTGVAEGTATITATATNSEGSAQDTIDVTVTAAGADDAEPTYNAATSLRNETFDSYASVAAFESASQWEVASGQQSNLSLITGFGGSGQAMRLSYGTAAQSGPGIFLLTGATVPHFYLRYRFRVTSGFSWPVGNDGVKWIEIFRLPSTRRWTNGVGSLSNADGPPGYEQTGNEFGFHDNSWQDFAQPDYNPFCQNVSKTPKFTDVNDGQWHEITEEYRFATGYGARRWLDTVLIGSTFDGDPGVPAGGFQCSTDGCYRIGFGDIMPAGAPQAWNLDLDDIRVWTP